MGKRKKMNESYGERGSRGGQGSRFKAQQGSKGKLGYLVIVELINTNNTAQRNTTEQHTINCKGQTSNPERQWETTRVKEVM